jgi:hypothetical protein
MKCLELLGTKYCGEYLELGGRKLQEFREKFVMRSFIIYVYPQMLIFG